MKNSNNSKHFLALVRYLLQAYFHLFSHSNWKTGKRVFWWISDTTMPTSWSRCWELLGTPYLAHVCAALGPAGDSTSSQLWDRPRVQDLPPYSLATSLLWDVSQTHWPLAPTQRFIMSLATHPLLLTNFFIWEHSLNGTQPPEISLFPLTIFFFGTFKTSGRTVQK